METEPQPQIPEKRKISHHIEYQGQPFIIEQELNPKNEIVSVTQKTLDGKIVEYVDTKMMGKIKSTQMALELMGIRVDETALNLIDLEIDKEKK